MDVSCGLKEIASHLSTGSGGARLKNCLIVFEMSLSLMVLVASGLLIKGLMRMNASDPGFQPAGLVIAPLLLSDPKYNEPKRTAAFYDDLVDRLRQTPGIAEAAAGMLIPYAGSDNLTRFAIDGQPPQQGQAQAFLRLDVVTLAYFPTMGIPLLAGRDFSRQDNADSARVAVINQTMARRHWPNEDPIGRRFRYGINLGATATVVGIVRDTKGQNEGDLPEPQAYLPHQQLPARSMRLIVRPGPGMSDIGAAIRRAAASVDKSQAVADFQTMEQLMVNIRTPFRIMGQVTSFFGGLSLFLAALGIYGVMAYSVAARRHEFGIRLALGAAARDLLALVLGQGLKLAAIGLALGLAGALAVTRLMTSVLYQVSPTDLSTFLGISALLLLVAAAASYLSARRASGLEPTRALRYE